MSDLSISPIELFNSHQKDVITTNINGIDTMVLQLSDEYGNYFAMPATDKELSHICGTLVLDKLIKQISYNKYNGKVAIIKAYY